MPSKPRNEFTSDRVSKIASKVLAQTRDIPDGVYVSWSGFVNGRMVGLSFEVSLIQSLAASALTQTKDKPKKNRK